MKSRRWAFVLAIGLDIALFAAIAGCSKKDGPTSPPGSNGPLDSGNFNTGEIFSFTFAAAGSFNYRCTNHAGMNGNVTVDAASPNTEAHITAGGSSNAFTPTAVTVKPGSTVTWHNAGGTHNVTSD